MRTIEQFQDYDTIRNDWIRMMDCAEIIGENSAYFSKRNKTKVVTYLRSIYTRLEAMKNVCDSQSVDSKGIEIQMPENLSLRDFSKCTDDLNKIFSQCPFLHTSDGQILFTGVDNGSIWLTFTITGGVIAIATGLAALVDKVIQIRSHAITLKQQQEEYRRMGMKNEAIKTIIEAQKTIVEQMTSIAVDSLSSEHNITDNEDKQRIKMALDLLGEWMERGLKIVASINAPDEIKTLFPPVEAQSLSNTKKELLEAAKTDSE